MSEREAAVVKIKPLARSPRQEEEEEEEEEKEEEEKEVMSERRVESERGGSA